MVRTGRPKVEWTQVGCANCGKLLERRVSDMARNKSGRVFCSWGCLRPVGPKPRRKAESVCRQCGQSFYPRTGGPNIYCSKACHDASQRKEQVQRTCEVCGTVFALKPSTAATNAGRFCSKRCEGVSRRKHPLEREHNGKPALLDAHGYVKVWDPTHATHHSGWVLEHRLVVEQILGRALTPDEHVHHLNGDKTDNRPENLAVLSPGAHSLITIQRATEQRARDRTELDKYRQLYGPLPD